MTATRLDLGDGNEVLVDLNRDVDPDESPDVILHVMEPGDGCQVWMPSARAREVAAALVRAADEVTR